MPQELLKVSAAVGQITLAGDVTGLVAGQIDHQRNDFVGSAHAQLSGAQRLVLLIGIEVEALQGSVVRRGQAAGVPTPIMSALYAVLKPHAEGPRID